MAYARSGFRSGEARSGDFDQSLAIEIGGTDRTTRCDFNTLEITEKAGAVANELKLDVRGFTPTKFQTVKIYNGGIDVGVPVFVGTIVDRTQKGHRAVDRPVFSLEVDDPVWRLDRYALVTKTYRDLGINTIVADLLVNFTDPASGFRPGYLPSSLGNVDEIRFESALVSDCLRRLADQVDGAIAQVDYQGRCSIFVTDADEGNVLSLTGSGLDFWGFTHRENATELATRVIWVGGGGVTTAPVAAGATTIAVDECGWYVYGSTVRSGPNSAISYTGVSVNAGPGTLTGVSGVSHDLAQGETIHVYAKADDVTAQTALAAALGGGQSGIAVRQRADGRLGYPECLKRASSELAFFKNALDKVTYTTTNPYTRAGRNVTVTLTTPTTINATLRIQECLIQGRRAVPSGTLAAGPRLDRTVTASPVYRTLVDTLVQAGVQ